MTRKMLLLLLVVSLFSGCSLIRKIGEMSPKQTALWMMNVFNAEYAELVREAQDYYSPGTTEAQRRVMRWKMALLRKVHPLIKSYVEALDAGEDPKAALENAIVEALGQILEAEMLGAPEDDTQLAEPPRPPTNSADGG